MLSPPRARSTRRSPSPPAPRPVRPASRPASRPDRLHRFFEASVARRPDAIALQDGALELTYVELDARANQLARHLAARGLRPGGRVGVLLNRSWRTYAVLLSVLKAGAAFVPIDPAAPPDRVGYIRADASLDLLVTTSDLAGELEQDGLVLLDHAVEDVLDRPRHPLPPTAGPQTANPLCYVIYTSGSSGRPKGVAVAHPSICNFVEVITEVYDVQPHDRVYQGMTISFDFSIEEIWPTFAAGATLVVGPTDSRRIGAELGEFLHDTGVTVFCCVPTLLATIPRDLPHLRTLMVGGEACNAGLVERWARPGRRMLNTYGPTEATVTATWGELLPGRPVTIGRPVPTYSVVILDDACVEVPHGGVGEICIGGPGVADGYVNLPEKTADRFIRHPAAPPNGDGRLYRTGDLGRFDDEGEIVYLGRADDEVKIRGHRVDLGEIENVALEDPAVESSVAALSKTENSEELAVYVTLSADAVGGVDAARGGVDDAARGGGDEQALVARLHELLRTRLPEYMVPGYLDVLESLPTQVSGKVDRSKLPAPRGPRIVSSAGPTVAPGTPLETRVRDVMAEALGLEPAQVSVEADFFDELGGHSLLAARVVTLLRRYEVGRSPAVRDLYDNPTVRALAGVLDAAAEPDGSVPPPARREPLRHPTLRYAAAGYAQGGVLFALLLVMTLPAAAVYAYHGGGVAPDVLAQLAVGATAIYLLQRWVLAPLAVRALGAGIRPGHHRMWGRVHLRLWASELMLSTSPLPFLSGGPLVPTYLRVLGARVGHDTHIGTSVLSLPSMVRIGDGATVGYGAALRPWTVQDGWVVVAPVTVGARAHVGGNCVIEPGALIGADAVVGEQSSVAREQVIPDGEHWAGSPSVPDPADAAVAELTEAGPAPTWTRPQLAAAAVGAAALDLISVVSLLPAVLLVWGSLLFFGAGPALLAAVLVGPVFVLTVCAFVAVGRWIAAPRTGPGVFPARSAVGLRKWFADKLLEMSLLYTNSLYSTLYTVGWLRLLGARIGRGAEISTASHIDPEMLTIEQGSFVADMASLGSATFHNGWMVRRPTLVGRRAFVGNAAVVPAGTRLGDDSLIGVATVPPVAGVPGDSTWLGSPAMNLPVRQDSGDFDESTTFRPPRHKVAERLGIEFLRATLPASMISVSLYLFLLGLSATSRAAPWWATVLTAPVLAVATGLTLLFMVAAVKWLVVGTYRPRTEPLWSRFVRRSEFVTGLYEAAAVPGLLMMLVGTPMLPPALRLLGCRIGRRTYLGTTYMTEYDLVDIGDDVVVGRDVSLQTHLFEDRVMKMSTVRIENGASVGDRAIVLYDAVVGTGAALDPLSLVMKGEHLPAETRWRGITAQPVTAAVPEEAAHAPADPAHARGAPDGAAPVDAAPVAAALAVTEATTVLPRVRPVAGARPGHRPIADVRFADGFPDTERTTVMTQVRRDSGGVVAAADAGRTMRIRSVHATGEVRVLRRPTAAPRPAEDARPVDPDRPRPEPGTVDTARTTRALLPVRPAPVGDTGSRPTPPAPMFDPSLPSPREQPSTARATIRVPRPRGSAAPSSDRTSASTSGRHRRDTLEQPDGDR